MTNTGDRLHLLSLPPILLPPISSQSTTLSLLPEDSEEDWITLSLLREDSEEDMISSFTFTARRCTRVAGAITIHHMDIARDEGI
ncbi:hypothetical protein GW17_00043418 [Ensete ventricosum]|nr:hypothetical protein GW17_00043418 [Ensete ventricosum]